MPRQSCETNGYELLFAILFASSVGIIHKQIQTYDDLLVIIDNLKIPNLYYKNFEINHKEQYIVSFLKLNIANVTKWIIDLNAILQEHTFTNIERIYLCGKTDLPDIQLLNKNVAKNEKRGDIYARDITGKFIAFSIKQNKKCTKTNRSVECVLGNHLASKKIKMDFLSNAGFPVFKKSERKKVNALFYDINVYFEYLKNSIEEGKELIINDYKKLYGLALPYSLYEYDSEKLHNLSNISINEISFEHHEPYYYMKNGLKRKAAKLFYQLKINEDIFRVEIRWKGNIHDASPQFQTHPE